MNYVEDLARQLKRIEETVKEAIKVNGEVAFTLKDILEGEGLTISEIEVHSDGIIMEISDIDEKRVSTVYSYLVFAENKDYPLKNPVFVSHPKLDIFYQNKRYTAIGFSAQKAEIAEKVKTLYDAVEKAVEKVKEYEKMNILDIPFFRLLNQFLESFGFQIWNFDREFVQDQFLYKINIGLKPGGSQTAPGFVNTRSGTPIETVLNDYGKRVSNSVAKVTFNLTTTQTVKLSKDGINVLKDILENGEDYLLTLF